MSRTRRWIPYWDTAKKREKVLSYNNTEKEKELDSKQNPILNGYDGKKDGYMHLILNLQKNMILIGH